MRDLDDHRHTEEASASKDLGKRLRARRKVLGKTLQQVADECGLTVGFISQIERDISVPSLASLCSVAKALETSVDSFLSQTPIRQHSIVSHSGTRPLYNVGGPGRYYEFLERGFPDALMNAALTHVPPGYASEIMNHEGEEFLFIVSGEMVYDVDGVTYHLKAGDTLHFQSNRPHRSRNEGKCDAVELWVGTMRLFSE
jgi:transcriptional regulator with XRE-family HTH domain